MAPQIGEDASAGALTDSACLAARAAGNEAYSAGDLAKAGDSYQEALACWEKAMHAADQAEALTKGQVVQYSAKGFFGVVMSVFPLFDEYFLKDLGSDQAIWVGDAGGTLRRFGRQELVPISKALVDFRLAMLQNLAAVSLRQDDFVQTVKWADLALCLAGRSPKALMRKGAALLRLNRPGPASDVLATAALEVPKDNEVRRLLREAEKMRSPTWVCVTGCCGPWGIVCGGPVSDSMSSVVAPAGKGGESWAAAAGLPGPSPALGRGGDSSCASEEEEEEAERENETRRGCTKEGCEDSSCDSDPDAEDQADKPPPAWAFVAGQAPAVAAPAVGADATADAAAPPAAAATAAAAAPRATASAAAAEPLASVAAAAVVAAGGGEDGDGSGATAPAARRRAAAGGGTSAGGEVAAAANAAAPDKQVVGLLWLAAVSAIVAAAAGIWMVLALPVGIPS